MADTIRTLAELNSLLSDNTSAAISAQDIRDLMVSQMCHAEIGSLSQPQETLGSGWQAVKLNQAGAFERGFAADAVGMKIIGTPVAMKVVVECEIVFCGAAAVAYEFAVFRNPAGSPEKIGRLDRTLTGNGTAQVAHGWAAGLQLSAGDELQFAVQANGQMFKLDQGRLTVRRIGVE